MRIGLQIPYFKYGNGAAGIRGKLTEMATTADDAGFYSVWVMDHFFQLGFEPLGPPEDPMLEAYTTLGYLAGLTGRVKLGTMITGVIYRYPALLAKTITTLDVLSGGRAYLGIGAAWYEKEAKALGVPFPSTGERFEWLEETLQIVQQMWSDNDGAYQGKHFQLGETLNVPQPLSQPRIPIMIGGMGEKKTLRMVAQYADACNLFGGAGTDVLKQKLDILHEHCATVGRDYDEIEKTTLNTIHLADGQMTADDVISLCREQAALGITHVIFNMPNTHDITPLEIIGKDVIPAVSAL